ncbi:ABC transporter ATP-binding protein [Kaistia terrae]|uniref:ABC transporter ATP-binding protein n=1 Tax=Kaistia terrae TaxID=537017 RepID=A0ABW0PQP0_9HYPH|nr:ABC transporter ATP-binding protein [Kaistia terrae]MCX5577710.1 ABC transporter ATP-binding protein [Kaistia terrae]
MSLHVRDIETRFRTTAGEVHAVNGVSFDVGDGELVGIVGESGSGKSVTINSILGLIRTSGTITSGTATFGGRDLIAMRSRDLRKIRGAEIGFIAQNPFGALNPVLRLSRQFENVVRAHRRLDRKEIRRQALAMLGHVGIHQPERVLDGYAHELSGGMAQRVVIALALMLDPTLVVADEPTTALDVTVQKQILDLISTLVRERERSMLIITHDLGVVANYCDRVVVMYCGRVMEDGPVREVFRRPYHPYALALLRSVPRAGQALQTLGGRLPKLNAQPVGCLFRDRCPYRMDVCDRVTPPLREVSPGRKVSCHLDVEQEVPTLVAG